MLLAYWLIADAERLKQRCIVRLASRERREAMDRGEVASSFAALTNASANEADFYLEAANYDLDRAVEMFYGALQHPSNYCDTRV